MTSERHTTLAWSPLSRANVGVHGGGRRVGRQSALDLYELARWNAAQRAAVAANREREARERERDARRARAVRAAMQRRDAIVECDS